MTTFPPKILYMRDVFFWKITGFYHGDDVDRDILHFMSSNPRFLSIRAVNVSLYMVQGSNINSTVRNNILYKWISNDSSNDTFFLFCPNNRVYTRYPVLSFSVVEYEHLGR